MYLRNVAAPLVPNVGTIAVFAAQSPQDARSCITLARVDVKVRARK
jgi:hypothetical protein